MLSVIEFENELSNSYMRVKRDLGQRKTFLKFTINLRNVYILTDEIVLLHVMELYWLYFVALEWSLITFAVNQQLFSVAP